MKQGKKKETKRKQFNEWAKLTQNQYSARLRSSQSLSLPVLNSVPKYRDKWIENNWSTKTLQVHINVHWNNDDDDDGDDDDSKEWTSMDSMSFTLLIQ